MCRRAAEQGAGADTCKRGDFSYYVVAHLAWLARCWRREVQLSLSVGPRNRYLVSSW